MKILFFILFIYSSVINADENILKKLYTDKVSSYERLIRNISSEASRLSSSRRGWGPSKKAESKRLFAIADENRKKLTDLQKNYKSSPLSTYKKLFEERKEIIESSIKKTENDLAGKNLTLRDKYTLQLNQTKKDSLRKLELALTDYESKRRLETTSRFKAFLDKLKTTKNTASTTPKTSTTSHIDKFKEFLQANKKTTPKVIPEPIKEPKKGIVIQAISAPASPGPINALPAIPKITPPKPKEIPVQISDGKTILKNVNIATSTKTGNIDTKGKLSIANVKVSKGTTLKDTNINADVKVKNISVSQGSSADIGSVHIQDKN